MGLALLRADVKLLLLLELLELLFDSEEEEEEGDDSSKALDWLFMANDDAARQHLTDCGSGKSPHREEKARKDRRNLFITATNQ